MNDRTVALSHPPSADPNRTQLGMPPVAFDPNRTVLGTAPTKEVTQTVKPMQCPVCRTFNPAGMEYCLDCGLLFREALPDDAFGAPRVRLPRLVSADGTEFTLRAGENGVGREGDVLLADPRVSRRHAVIVADGTQILIEDLGSSNGTKVDGAPLVGGSRIPILPGAKLSFGGYELTLVGPDATSEADATQMGGGNRTQTFSANTTTAMAAPPQVAGPAARLVGGDQSLPLKAGPNTFGRKADNDVVLTDGYVSGRHGLIEVEDDAVYITDTGSTNGTTVSGLKLEPNVRTRLAPDDVIRLGALELRVER